MITSRTIRCLNRFGSARTLFITTTILFLLLAMTLMGCADMKPLDYRAIDQIKPGPGLFTGEDGEFLLYGSNRESVLD